MNISAFLSHQLDLIEKIFYNTTEHRQTSNTGLVGILAISMIFVSFMSNKPGSMGPLLQANIQNASGKYNLEYSGTLQNKVITLDGVEYLLIPKN